MHKSVVHRCNEIPDDDLHQIWRSCWSHLVITYIFLISSSFLGLAPVGLIFLSCFAPARFWTPHSSPTGCHPCYRCPKIILVFSPWSFASNYFWCEAFVLSYRSSVCGEFFCSISFQMPSASMSLFLRVQVSCACSSTLIAHDLIMLCFVRVLMCMLLHTFLNLAISPVARAILVLNSLLQSLSQVNRIHELRDIFNLCITNYQVLYVVLVPCKQYSCGFVSVDLQSCGLFCFIDPFQFSCSSSLSSSCKLISSANLDYWSLAMHWNSCSFVLYCIHLSVYDCLVVHINYYYCYDYANFGCYL